MESADSPRKSTSSASSSPEFEFWMVRNRAEPTQGLHSADEIFFDGIILPLDLLSIQRSDPSVEQEPPDNPPAIPSADPPVGSILSSSSCAPTSGSRRWKDLFKVVGEKKPEEKDKDKEKERKKVRRITGGTSAELNITLNIWPFSRSRSAGTTSGSGVRSRPSDSITGRKVSSAPCSRSNSRGENTKPSATSSTAANVRSRKWAPSPGRGGVHLGRSSPVCQLRRAWAGSGEKPRKHNPVSSSSSSAGNSGARMLNLNMNSCIGYRNQVKCRGFNSDRVPVGDCSVEAIPNTVNLLARLSKKVY